MHEQLIFSSIAQIILQLIEDRQKEIEHLLSCSGNSVSLEVKIQSLDKPVSIEFITSEKYKINIVPPENKKISDSTNINTAHFKKEVGQAVKYYLDKCKFYTTPIKIVFHLKPQNIICGSVTSNFNFKD